MSAYFGAIMAIARKDILIEARSKDFVVVVATFSLLVIVFFSFAVSPTPSAVGFVAPGLLWIAIVFGGSLGLNRSFALEKENGAIDALLLAPVSRETIFYGKALSSFLFMVVVELATAPAFAALFNYSPTALASLAPTALLSTLGIVVVGSVFSAMAVNTRAREVMLPLLFLPVALPAVIAAVELSAGVLEGGGVFPSTQWLGVLAAFDAVFLVVCPFAFNLVVED